MSIASNALLSENRLVVAQVATLDASEEIDSDAIRVAKVKADIQLFLQDSDIRWSDAAKSTAQQESEAGIVCVLILLYISSYYHMCPHTTICILILLYMCPHTTTCIAEADFVAPAADVVATSNCIGAAQGATLYARNICVCVCVVWCV